MTAGINVPAVFYDTISKIPMNVGCIAMTINKIQNVFKAYSEQSKIAKIGKPEKVSPTMQKDEVILSSQAQGVSSVYPGLYSLPEVREDRVRDLSQRIAAGTYHVDARDIVDTMLKR